MKLTSQASEYALEEISGTEYETVEACQESFLEPLARLIADAIRQTRLLDKNNHDTMEPKRPEVTRV